jgi:hypothetical protein
MSHIAFSQPMASVELLYQAHLYGRLIDMPLHPWAEQRVIYLQ